MAEVLFAIIILGMGLILLAAAFPVGLTQTRKTQDVTTANLVARMAFDQMTKVPAAGVRTVARLGCSRAGDVLPDASAPCVSIMAGPTAGSSASRWSWASSMARRFADDPRPALKLVYPTSAGPVPLLRPIRHGRMTPPGPGDPRRLPPAPPCAVPFPGPWSGASAPRSSIRKVRAPQHPSVARKRPVGLLRRPALLLVRLLPPDVRRPILLRIRCNPMAARRMDALQPTQPSERGGSATTSPAGPTASRSSSAKVPEGQRPCPSAGHLTGGTSWPLDVPPPTAYADTLWTAFRPAPHSRLATICPANLSLHAPADVWISDASRWPDCHAHAEASTPARSAAAASCSTAGATSTGRRSGCRRRYRQRLDQARPAPLCGRHGSQVRRSPIDINDFLPLWFNPNAIAVFPTIMTKQADLP